MSETEGRHLAAVSRAYGPETWEVYDFLDESLDPRGPDAMLGLAIERLTQESRVLDVGCRDAAHLVELVRATGASGVGLDPVARLLDQAHKAVGEAGLGNRIEIVEGTMHDIPFPDSSFDLVWCRDVIEVVVDLDTGVAEMARVLRPSGTLIVFTVLATDRLEPKERRLLLGQSLAVVADNLIRENVERAFRRAGLAVVARDEIGTEWREYAEERSQPASQALLRLARLRRSRARIVEQAGEDVYAHIESNLHWLVYQFLGKLLPTIYVLGKTERLLSA
jgi:ubiquinone/menaquinone biosynthesis C-methylase UbiE